MRESLKRLVYRLGADPKKSLKWFLFGLALFAIGTFCIYQGYIGHHMWQVPGMGLMLVGIVFSVYGYIGIFANRWSQFLDKFTSKNNTKP